MDNLPDYVPDDESLKQGLARIFCANAPGVPMPAITLLKREYNEHSSTYPSEMVECRLPDGKSLRLHCKYSDDRAPKGHRKGCRHEARVYRDILWEVTVTAPKYYGDYFDPDTGASCLVLEYIDEALKSSKAEDGIQRAAFWLGEFHRQSAKYSSGHSFLEKFDAAYYQRWARRTASFARAHPDNQEWLESLCESYEGQIEYLLATQSTIIHGEFYPANILINSRGVYAVDWESAAVGPGELDLAALVEGWPDAVISQCIEIYRQCRWPEGAPATFSEALPLAGIHWHLRWLGDNPNWREPWRLANLKLESEKCGLV